MLLRSATTAFLCLLSITSVILVAHLYNTKGAPSPEWIPPKIKDHLSPELLPKPVPASQDVNCSSRIDWLDRKERLSNFNYARRDILVRADPATKRTLMTTMERPLFPELQPVDLSADSIIELQHCMEPLVLKVPSFSKSPPIASNLIFGIQTTMARLDDTIETLVRWLPKTGAKLFVVVKETEDVEADADAMKELEAKLRAQDLDATLVPPFKGDVFSERYFSLVKIMYEHRDDKTEWIGLIDDDTFFPSMHSLLDMLAKYDPKDQHYIGALSEDWWSVTTYGYMGFGGAGVFLSVNLAEVIDRNYEKCKASTDKTAGDIRVKNCIYGTTNIKLTHIPELHQVDFHGDKSGYYESGHQPLSLHHWKDRRVDSEGWLLPRMHLVADICGDCFMQRWQFGDDTVLSNGFSIAKYPNGKLKKLDMNKMEATWDNGPQVKDSHNHGFEHSLEPTRPKLKPREKVQFMLLDAVAIEGGVRQTYLHEGADQDLDTILELFWKEDLTMDKPAGIESDQKGEVGGEQSPSKSDIPTQRRHVYGDLRA